MLGETASLVLSEVAGHCQSLHPFTAAESVPAPVNGAECWRPVTQTSLMSILHGLNNEVRTSAGI